MNQVKIIKLGDSMNEVRLNGWRKCCKPTVFILHFLFWGLILRRIKIACLKYFSFRQ